MEFNIGYQHKVGNATLWAEAGTQAGGSSSEHRWKYRAGVSFAL